MLNIEAQFQSVGVKVFKMTSLHDLRRLHHAELYFVSYIWNDGFSCVREILKGTLFHRARGLQAEQIFSVSSVLSLAQGIIQLHS